MPSVASIEGGVSEATLIVSYEWVSGEISTWSQSGLLAHIVTVITVPAGNGVLRSQTLKLRILLVKLAKLPSLIFPTTFAEGPLLPVRV